MMHLVPVSVESVDVVGVVDSIEYLSDRLSSILLHELTLFATEQLLASPQSSYDVVFVLLSLSMMLYVLARSLSKGAG